MSINSESFFGYKSVITRFDYALARAIQKIAMFRYWITRSKPALRLDRRGRVMTDCDTACKPGNDKRYYILFTLTAFTILLGYVFYTNHIWEDFFITFRHSQNLVHGHGLVYTPGKLVHGFTSPLNVLLPALFYWITGQVSYVPALWLYRIVTIGAFICAGLILLNFLFREKKTSAIFFCIYFLFEIKCAAFSVNGQETAFMLFFLAASLVFAYRGLANVWIPAGICWAGLMWTRPDGWVYVGILAFTGFIFSKNDKKSEFFAIVKTGCVCTALYLPWFIWVWIYYGTPIPHTVIAKGADLSLTQFDIVRFIETGLARFSSYISFPFKPIYWEFGGWPYWVTIYSFLCGCFCCIYWLLPGKDRFGKIASMVFTCLCLYFSCINVLFPWYLPPITLCGIIVLARGFWRIIKWKPLAYILNIGVSVAIISLFVMSTIQLRIQQKEIEFGHRKQIGLWLKNNIQKDDTVYLEPLGYIGYFSEADMLDFPGLVAPEVVKLRKEKKLNFAQIIPELKPDWIVVRPWKLKLMSQIPEINDQYKIVKVFDVTDKIKQYGYVPGAGYLLVDAKFYIVKKIT